MIKKLIFLTIWLLYIVANYFILPYFVQPFLWIFICLILMIFSLRELIKLYNERKNIKIGRIISSFLTISLFFITFYNVNKIPRNFLEKIDWSISYNKRNQIVKDVINGNLKPNTAMNNGICKLPFQFPIISNGGNDIWIYENKVRNTKTVKFWISRGFFDSPQAYFIYTNDDKTKKYFNDLINSKPESNWKLEKNWYRIMESE